MCINCQCKDDPEMVCQYTCCPDGEDKYDNCKDYKDE